MIATSGYTRTFGGYTGTLINTYDCTPTDQATEIAPVIDHEYFEPKQYYLNEANLIKSIEREIRKELQDSWSSLVYKYYPVQLKPMNLRCVPLDGRGWGNK